MVILHKSAELIELEIIGCILKLHDNEYKTALKRKAELMKILHERKEIFTVDEFLELHTNGRKVGCGKS